MTVDVLPDIDIPPLPVTARLLAPYRFPVDFDARPCPGPMMVDPMNPDEPLLLFDGTPIRHLCGRGTSYPDDSHDFEATMHYLDWRRGESGRDITCEACGWRGMMTRPAWTVRTWARLMLSTWWPVAAFTDIADVPPVRRWVGRLVGETWADAPW